MPTLDWIGKDKVINHHMDVPYRVLEEQYSYGEDSENMIIHGDNLSALKSLLPQYEGRIKCIYIDPPYNTGNEGWVYNDNVNDPRIKEWLGEVVGTEGVDLSRHDKWLCMMYPRLKLLHRLLSDDGAIFISIDDNEQANLKLICDEIFGTCNFISQIAWKRKKEISNDSKNVAIQGEYILCYGKPLTKLALEPLSNEYTNKSYNEPTYEFPNGKWRPVPLTVSKGLSGGGYTYTITTPTGKEHTRLWAYPEESFKKLLEENRVYFGKNKNGLPQRVMYLAESKGQPISNYWDNVATNKEGKKDILAIFEDNIFDTPKPIGLIEKIMRVSLKETDIILDSFAGSGTTAHAVLNMNKADGGNRKFILIEMCDYAETITAERVKRVIDGYGEGKKAVDGAGGGFKFYELGEKLLDGDYLNENVGTDKIREYVYFTETKQHITNKDDEPYFMGKYLDTAYYFYYEKNAITTLDRAFLHTVRTKAESYVIYADKCIISDEELEKNHIKFKKIPRDITRL